MAAQPPCIFDRQALLRRRERAARRNGDTFLAREAAEGLVERISAVNRRFVRAAGIDSLNQTRDLFRPAAENWRHVDFGIDETIDLEPGGFDLVTSVFALHSVNDLPGALIQIRRALKPDGLFVAALFGGATLKELRDTLARAEIETRGGASPRVYPFADVRDLGGLLQRAGFALPVADLERTNVLYRDFFSLVADLRALGETNALLDRDRAALPRRTLAKAIELYATGDADENGRLRATFEIIYLTGWAPDPSQQKPLKPGSARTRLADALGTDEQPAGEKVMPPRKA
jgi:SAM-dependent methyltransferase